MSVLVLGTSSHVGKSTVVAAICRVLANRGIVAAPFKSQNMSLNSYVTRDGCEIGIAQAMQAFAARLVPEADMNPVLLKPKGEKTSQVVLLGHPYKDLPIQEYYQETDHLLSEAVASADRLMKKYGNIVAEGAGGAAEVNLYKRDIANIRLARELKVPIILVADIERGGVFAQIYGTIMLLPEDIRGLVRGIIINKFRGDPVLFERGREVIEELCGIPVLGVLPYLTLHLPSEDSLSLGDKKAVIHPVKIAVIRLPHISNFTDFERLERYVNVTYVPLGSPLQGYDCIILPGTKNTVDDLAAVWKYGTAREIIAAKAQGIPVLGICGGYQMLGQTVSDSGIESTEGTWEGLGLLDVTTRFERYEKKTEQICRSPRQIGPILSAMGPVQGYEIHMGETTLLAGEEAFIGEGAVSSDGLVIGTYMHGLFENPGAVNALLSFLHQKKNLAFPEIDGGCCQDPYDLLAEEFERHVSMEPLLACFSRGRPSVPGDSTGADFSSGIDNT